MEMETTQHWNSLTITQIPTTLFFFFHKDRETDRTHTCLTNASVENHGQPFKQKMNQGQHGSQQTGAKRREATLTWLLTPPLLAPACLVAPVFRDGDGGEGWGRFPPPFGWVSGGREEKAPCTLLPLPLVQGQGWQDGHLQPLILKQRVVAAARVNYVWFWRQRFQGGLNLKESFHQ